MGNMPITTNIDSDSISIILDTSTVDYAENTLFNKSSLENTYVIDHHGKINGKPCIEEELGLSSENVIRNPNASSVCEILVNELQPELVTPQIANMLSLGLLTDTAKLKFLKSNTLENLSKLIEMGADYEGLLKFCSRKSFLREEVGMAQAFLKTKKFQIGDTFGTMLFLDNSEVDNLNKTYGIRLPQKKIFKLSDIEDCSFNCIAAENNSGEYNCEFRSTKILGNFNVLQLATLYGGGGHYSASGCPIKTTNEHTKTNIESQLEQQVVDMYSEQATNLEPIHHSEQDEELANIFTQTNHLSEQITPDILQQINSLVKSGANYEYTYKTFKTFEQFMLENEILSRIPSEMYSQKFPKVLVNLSQKDIEILCQQYHVSEDEILSSINTFSNINIDSAMISLPNGRKSSIDKNGNISITPSMEEKETLTDLHR